MGKIFDAMTTFFKQDGWPIHRIGQDLAYSMAVEGDHGKWTAIAQAWEDDNIFLFYSACPVEAPAGRQPLVAELLTRINFTLVVGNFEMDFTDGHIRYRTSIDITGHQLGALLIHQLVYRNVLTMDKYLPAIQAVIQGERSPVQALAKIEG